MTRVIRARRRACDDRAMRHLRAFAMLALLGCGGNSPTPSDYSGSCDLRKTFGICSEYDGQTASDAGRLELDCALTGTWSDTARCPPSTLGGCRNKHSTLSGYVTGWYFAGSGFTTSDEVRAACMQKGGTFLPPT